MEIDAHGLLDDLEKADAATLDSAPFGVVRMQTDGTVLAYNAYEAQLSGLSSANVIGRRFFTEVAPCTNNFMVAERYLEPGPLDADINYVFTYRMNPTKVRLRLLRRADATEQYLVTTKAESRRAASDKGEVERLLQFLYLCPVGLADHGANGEVRMMNALAVQMLMPLSRDGQMANVFTVLKEVAPDLPVLVQQYSARSGMIVQDRAVTIRNQSGPRHYSLSILRIEGDTHMATLSDVTQTVVNEEVARVALRSQAVEEGRVEILTGVLHDIGNGITGMGTRTAILGAAPPWDELGQLSKLGTFLRQRQPALEASLGVDKAAALQGFVDTIIASFQQRAAEWRETVALFAKSILHVQEIINIQRQFIHGGSTTRRVLYPGELLEDALAIQRSILNKRGIKVVTESGPDVGSLDGDRTQLMQVFVNVLRNAAEAFDANNGGTTAQRTLSVMVRRLPSDRVEFAFTDNACGFDAPQGTFAITRGHTTKRPGSGLGLSSCAQIVASHGGKLTLRSPGSGKGATCSIVLPMASPVECEASP